MADAPVRILLVEDSDIDSELLAGHLAKAELEVRIRRVVNRRGFVEALADDDTDIILADYSLPDFDGLSALNIAREVRPSLPFIFVSGVIGEEFATNAIKRGATDYVVKRNLSRLPTAIERALAEARERADRMRAEAEVRALNATLEEQVEARTRERDRIWRLGLHLFAVIDAEGRLQAVNPAWSRNLGHSQETLVGLQLAALVHPDDLDTALEALEALRGGNSVERLELRLRHIAGDYRWIAWTAVTENDRFYGVGRDITGEKEAAASLAEANRNLRDEIVERERVEQTLSQMQRLEAVGQLTSGVAHDFNNLLTVILGNIGFIERGMEKAGVDGKLAERLGHVRQAAERGASLTAQLLAFSRRQRLEPKAVELNETVAAMRDLLQSTMGGSVRIETVLKKGLWQALVDPTQIEMIILNLAINARDAMEVGGSLTVETANVTLGPPGRPEEPAAGDYVAVMVSDTGSGMSEEVLAKAFEPFFTTKPTGKGSGLGLAQVFGFAKQSGGGVRIDTRVGEGTSVKVYLPRAMGTGEKAAAPAISEAVVAGGAFHRTILLVDDDSAVREVTATLLVEAGYRVLEAGSGRAALDRLKHEPVDLLLVDYAMPGMNGAETAAAAQAIEPGLAVLFITGYADLAALKEVGEDRIIQKPYRGNELNRKVEAVLNAAGVRDEKVVPFKTAR